MKLSKKIWTLMAIATLMLAFAATGCTIKEVSTLTIINPPAVTYAIGETPTLNFTVKAVMDDGTERTLTYKGYSSVLELSGFSTAKEGTFTATVTYRNVSATFDYVVVAPSSDFAGGIGTENNPYVISTVEQFLKIGNAEYKDKYFKLNADLDFTDYPISESRVDGYLIPGYWNNFYWYSYVNEFNGYLDGNGYKLYNVATQGSIPGGLGFITVTKNATIKNLDYFNNSGVPFVVMNQGTSLLENVNCFGAHYYEGNNIGAFFTYNFGALTMKDCDNHVDMLGNSKYIGGFIGQPSGNISLTMINCNNYGKVTGIQAAAFFANCNSGNYAKNITMTNCYNYGEIIGTTHSALFFAIGASDGDESYVTADNCGSIKEPVTLKANDGYKVSVNDTTGEITVELQEREGVQVAKVVLILSYWSKTDSATLLQSTSEEINFIGATSVTAQIVRKIGVVNGTLSEGETTWSTIQEINGQYYYVNDMTNGWTVGDGKEGSKTSVIINVLAYDSNGNIVAGGQLS